MLPELMIEVLIMKMDEFRRQMETIQWPVIFRVDGREIAVNAREEVMIPSAGELICIYHGGAFDVIDCNHLSIIHRGNQSSRQPT
jgi:hypothetical protein